MFGWRVGGVGGISPASTRSQSRPLSGSDLIPLNKNMFAVLSIRLTYNWEVLYMSTQHTSIE